MSFLEGGKSQPSREMVLVLGSTLDLPPRERNAMLLAAGFAPAYRESPFQGDDGALVRDVDDRRGDIVRMNAAASALLPLFLADPTDERARTNVHHAILSPNGIRPFIVDWPCAAAFLIERVRREVASSVDDDPLREILAELMRYEGVVAASPLSPMPSSPILAVDLVRGDVELRLFSTLTTLGTPLDVTAQELTIESFFPADERTAALLASKAPS